MRCLSWHLKYAVTRWRVEQERHQQRHGQITGAGGRKGLKHMGNWIWENTGVNKREWRREEWSLRCSWRGRQGLDHWGPNSWEFGLSSDNDQTQKVPERDRIQPRSLWSPVEKGLTWGGGEASVQVGKQVGSYWAGPGGRRRHRELGWREVIGNDKLSTWWYNFPAVSSEFGHGFHSQLWLWCQDSNSASVELRCMPWNRTTTPSFCLPSLVWETS